MTKKKWKTKAAAVFAALLLALGGLIVLNAPTEAHAALPTSYTLNGAEISIPAARVDPFTVEDSEGALTKLTFSYGTDSAVFTTAWLYPKTPERAGVIEYAFEWKDNGYKLKQRAAGGGLYIPVNGLVVSLKEDNASWAAAAVGSALGKNGTFPDYIGAVEMTTASGTAAQAADKKIRIPLTKMNGTRKENEIVYYNAEWGPVSGQNEFGTEALFVLQDNGEFVIQKMRGVRDTSELQLNARSFVISIHGTLRSILTPGAFVDEGDTAQLLGMQFVNLTKSNSRKLTAKNPTQPVKATDVDLVTDPDGKTPFPGFRAENYLMYYDASYDKSVCSASNAFSNFTGCNEWGYEVRVRRTSQAGAVPVTGVIEEHKKQIDSCDADSFILSGNGAAETFLINSALNGAEVRIDASNKVTITTTPASYVTTAGNKLETAEEMMRSAVDAKYKLGYMGEGDTAENNKWTRASAAAQAALGQTSDAAGQATLYGMMKQLQLDEQEGIINNVHLADFYDLYLKVINQSLLIESMSYQGNAVMSIAAWHRPVAAREKTTAAIRETLELFRSVNMNTVYLETFWNGYSMSADSKYVDYHIDFDDNVYEGYDDYLSAFIGEAHKLGIEVHAWVEDFFVGYQGYDESNVLTGQKPNSSEQLVTQTERSKWVIRDYQGNEYTQFEGGKYKFIDPSNPQVRKFLVDYYVELLTEYDLDGINLDYIRYPVQNFYGYDKNDPDVPYDHGYSEFAAKKFLAEQGVEEKNQTLAYLKRQLNKKTSFEAEETAKAWSDFKIRQINEFVAEVKTAVDGVEAARKAAPDSYTETNVIISTSVFPDADVTVKKSQDWFSWVQAGLIEVTTPMAYYTNANTVAQKIMAMVGRIGGVTFNYGGIAPYFMGLSAFEEVTQALSSLQGGAFGTVIFDSKTIMNSELAREYLSNGIYGGAAVTPHKQIDKLLSAFTDEMKSRAGLYEIEGAKLTAFNAALDAMKGMPFSSAEEIQAIMAAAYAMGNDARNYASGHAATRIAEEMTNLVEVLDVHLSRYYIDVEGWVPSESIRPDRVTPPPPPDDGGDEPGGEEPGGDGGDQATPKGCGCGSVAGAGAAGAAAVALIALGTALLLKRKSGKAGRNAGRK